MNKLLFLIILILAANNLRSQQLTLIKDKNSSYSIVIPEMATSIEWQSAKVLQDYLQRIADCYLPITMDTVKEKRNEILIGKVNRGEGLEIPYDTLGKDGLFIKTTRDKLILTGGDNKGILYATYTFLDKYLGCRKFSSGVTFVPKRNKIVVDKIKDIELPAFAFRETTYRDARDPEYTDWHKLNTGGGTYNEKRSWGLWVHTFETLVDPRIYGKGHPEYFSFYNGRRHPGGTAAFDGTGFRSESQLCLSNPHVLELVCRNLKEAMKKYPDALYWSVSQNDNINYCRCDKCMDLNKKYSAYTEDEKMIYEDGVPVYSTLGMGSILWFINKVAERFPDKIISTLAYTYSRTSPKGIIPRKNVNIMLCNIESPRNKPLTGGDNSFVEDLSDWSKLTKNILVWDYTICFGNLLAPFPNLRTLQPNLQLFYKNGVSALYQQANREVGGEFAHLRAYLISRLMWNPDINVQKERDEFLNGYYGPAADEIAAYIKLLHDNNKAGNTEMGIFDSPVKFKNSFLTEELIQKYDSIFDQAYKKTSELPDFYQRVQEARLPVIFAKLEIARKEVANPRGMFYRTGDSTLVLKPWIQQDLLEFVYIANRACVSRISEWHTTPNDYLENYSWYFNLAAGSVKKENAEGIYLFSMKTAPVGYQNGYIDLKKGENSWTANIMIGYQKNIASEVVLNGVNKIDMKISLSGLPLTIQFDINNGVLIGTTNYGDIQFPITAHKVAE